MKIIFSFLFSFSLFIVSAQLPQAMSYQGFISDPITGSPVPDGAHTIKLRYYDAATNGNFQWESSNLTVNSFRGLFAAIIPVPSTSHWDVPLFVELIADGRQSNSRIQLTAVPYAFRTYTAPVASSMNGAGITGTVSDLLLNANLKDLSDGELSASKVGPGIKGSSVTDATGGAVPSDNFSEDLKKLAKDGLIDGPRLGNGINAANIVSGVFAGDKVGTGVKTTNISTGSNQLIPSETLDADLTELSGGAIAGSKIGSGVNAELFTNGVLSGSLAGSGIKSNYIDNSAGSGKIDNNSLSPALQDLADGSLSGSAIGSMIKANLVSDISRGLLSNDMLSSNLRYLGNNGVLDGSKIGTGVTAGNFGKGLLPNARLNVHLRDLSDDSSLSPSRIETPISASNFTNGVLNNSRLDSDLQELGNGSISGSKLEVPLAASIFSGGTLNDPRLSIHLKDLADGSLSGDKIGTGINADNITTGTISATRFPNEVVGGSDGFAIRIPYWTSSNQIGYASSFRTNNLGLSLNGAPSSSISLQHDATHPLGTGVNILNTSANPGLKVGMNINLISNPAASTYGIFSNVETTGVVKFGVWTNVISTPGSTSTVAGMYARSKGNNSAGNRGITAQATNSTGNPIKYGIAGRATSIGDGPHYGVYGNASGGTTNYGVYSNGNLWVQGSITQTGAFPPPSDRRLKESIEPLTNSLASVMKLLPSTFNFRTDEFPTMRFPEGTRYGLIAQDVEKVFSELVTSSYNPPTYDTSGKKIADQLSFKTLNTISLIPVLIQAMQEQNKQITELQAQVKKLKAQKVKAAKHVVTARK